MAPVRIELFGGLTLTVRGNEEAPRLSSQKSLVLLAYLAYHADRQHSREVLMEMLWAEVEPEAARNRLNVTLSRLRSHLESIGAPSDVLQSDRLHVWLDRKQIETDVSQFESHLDVAKKSTEAEEKVSHLTAALELYRGSLLPGVYESWVVAEQEKLRDRAAQAMSTVVQLLKQTGQLDRAIAYARRMVSAEPLLEQAHESLIRLLMQAGRHGDALQQYRSLENMLSRELDIVPSVEMEALLEAIRKASAQPSGNGSNGRGLVHATETLSTSVESPLGVDDVLRPPVPEPSRTRIRPSIMVALAVGLALLIVPGVSWLRSRASRPQSPPALKSNEPATLLWEWKYAPTGANSSEGDSEPTAITSDAKGGIYVAGYTQTKKQDVDFLTLKFDSDGRQRWIKRWNYSKTNDCDRPRAVAVDASGNVYVSGESYGGEREKTGTEWDVAIVKYDPDGKELWTRRFDSPAHNDDRPLGMALDKGGNIYLAAATKRIDGTEQCALSKYDSNGAIAWTVYADALSNGLTFRDLKVQSFTADAQGNIFLCGGATVTDAAGRQTHDLFTLRYDRHGNQVWHRRFAADNSQKAVGRILTVDADQNVYVAGTYKIAGNETVPNDNGDLNDGTPRTGYLAYGSGPGKFEGILVVKYDSHGNEIWSVPYRPLHAQPEAEPRYLESDGQGGIYVSAALTGGRDRSYQSQALHVSAAGRLTDSYSFPHLLGGCLALMRGEPYWWGTVGLGDGNPWGFKTEIAFDPLRNHSLTRPTGPHGVRVTLPPDRFAEAHVLHQCQNGQIVGAGQVWNGRSPSIAVFTFAP